MYAVIAFGVSLPQTFATVAEAAEFAQEELKLPPDADWRVVPV